MRIKDKNGIVTGASSGIGRAVADAFDWRAYRVRARSWLVWAVLAFAANLVAMALMVLRPHLPGL